MASIGIIQDDRTVRLSSSLPDSTLLVASVQGREALSELFEYRVRAYSEDWDLDLDALLGLDICIHVDRPDGEVRHLHGYVSECSHLGYRDEFAEFEFELRPWLWFLTQTTDCKIFQDMSVPDIVQLVLNDEGFTDIDMSLSGSYATRNYCVQYQESDFNFVSRLLEEEGIYYYFRHTEGQHTMVLCDGIGAHGPVAGYETVPFYPEAGDQLRERDHISQLSMHKRVHPGRVVMNDYGFLNPKENLVVSASDPSDNARADFEAYDYAANYPFEDSGRKLRSHAEMVVRRRMDAYRSRNETLSASGVVFGLTPGCLFELTGHHKRERNQEYLVVEHRFALSMPGYIAGDSNSGMDFSSELKIVPSNIVYCAVPVHPHPRMLGPQTAKVVGASGEEIWTDQHGRVKLQFHWDRYGESNEYSSCWVRVSQAWAGGNWGSLHVPRIGQEVIVDFIEGDPDQPIVTGRVYNGDNAVPYELPANATQSGIKSRSSKGGDGSNFNEIRMEDKKGEEELYFHAEKNQTIVVENCKSESVGVDESISIGNDRVEDVGNDETRTIGNDENVTIGNDKSVTIGNDRNNTIGANETLSVGADRKRTVSGNETISVTQMRNHTVGINELITVGGAQEVAVAGFQEVAVGGLQRIDVGVTRDVNVASDQGVKIGGNQTVDVSDDHTESIGKNMAITIGESLSIVCGKASITLKKDGTITVSGVDISFKADGKYDVTVKKATNINSKGNIKMKGKKILQN